MRSLGTSICSPSHNQWVFHHRKLISLHFQRDIPLYPFCFEDVVRDVSAWYSDEGRCYAMLIAVWEGEVVYRVEEKDFKVVPGQMLLVPEFTPFSFSSQGKCHKYVLELKGCHLTSILSRLELFKTELFPIETSSPNMALFLHIGNNTDCTDFAVFSQISGECYALLLQLSLLRLHHIPKLTPLPRILSLLEENLQQEFSLKSLCTECRMNKVTLSRLVKDHTGLSPYQYRLARKIERAIYFLQIPTMTIKEIAYMLGYCNQFYFSSEFKRFTGSTPSAYRRFQIKLRTERDSY